jgi:hypothetical protein
MNKFNGKQKCGGNAGIPCPKGNCASMIRTMTVILPRGALIALEYVDDKKAK